MWFYGHGMGGGGWLLMWLVWAPLIVALVWMITRPLVQDPETSTATPSPQREAPSAKEILDRRFASGEIGAETYREMRAALGTDPHRGPGDDTSGAAGT